jgi:hypothetical protein
MRYDNTTQRKEEIKTKSGLIIYVDSDRKTMKIDYPIPGWTGEDKRYGNVTPIKLAIFWMTFKRYHDKVEKLSDLYKICNYMEKYLESDVLTEIKQGLENLSEKIPDDIAEAILWEFDEDE